MLANWVFKTFVLAGEAFSKALRILQTCVLVNNNLCEKSLLSLELPTKFEVRFRVNSGPFSILILTY